MTLGKMAPLNRLQDPSLRFLLWLEWILLGLTALGEFRNRFQLFDERLPLLSLLCIAILGLLGLRLPQRPPAFTLGYMALNLCLVLLASVVGHIQFFFLLCVVLMLRSCLILNRQGRWLTMATLFGVFITIQDYRLQAMSNQALLDNLQRSSGEIVRPFFLGGILLFALVLIFLQLMITALLAERSSREKLAIANHQLRLYACQIEEVATLQERTRIARDIHDALGHGLTALHLNLNAALGLWEQDISEAKILLGEAADLSQVALADVRQAVSTLRAEPLQDKTINDWLQDLSQKLSQTAGIQPECIVNIAQPISDAQNMAAYRIVQEALTNVTKYAQATEVTIRLHTQHHRQDSNLVIAIQDNGKGFERSQNTSGFGLRGMEERAIAMGGTLSIDTTPGGGTHIVACLPLLNS